MVEFKVGDRVRIINDVYAMGYNHGREGIIRSFFQDEYYCYVDFEDDDYDSVKVADDIELIVRAPVAQRPATALAPSVRELIETIEANLATLKSTVGL